MGRTYSEIRDNEAYQGTEWEVSINGNDYTSNLELVEFRETINSPLEFTLKTSGISGGNSDVVQNNEVIVKYGGELFRGVIQQVDSGNNLEATIKGAGYASTLDGESAQNDSTPEEYVGSNTDTIVNDLTGGFAVGTNTRLNSTDGTVDFRANEKQLQDLNRLIGEYEGEWLVDINNGTPQFNVVQQRGGGSSVKTFSTVDTNETNQTAEAINRNVNTNEGDFDGVKVFGYGDGDDQIVATAGNVSKDDKVLIYTDKTIISQRQADQRATSLANSHTIEWEEIKIEPTDPNELFDCGDVVTVNDEAAKIDGEDFRVVERFYKIDYRGNVASTLMLSNKPQTFTAKFKEEENSRKSETDHMQGSRNVWGEKEVGNATNAKPITIDFYVPQDIKDKTGKNRTSSVELNYSCSPFRKNSSNSETRVSSTNLTKSNKVDSTNTTSNDKMDSTSTDNDDGLEESPDNQIQMERVGQESVGSTGSGGSTIIQQTATSGINTTLNIGDGWTDLEDDNGSQIDFSADYVDSAGGIMYYQFDVDLGFQAGSNYVGYVDVRVKREFDNVYYPGSGGRNHLLAINNGDQVDKISGVIEIPENTNGDDFIIQAQTRISDFDITLGQIGLVIYGEHSHDVSPNHEDTGGNNLASPGGDGSLTFRTDNFIYDITDNTSSTVDSVNDNTSSTTDDVTDTNEDTVVSVGDELLEGTTANEIESIVIDGTERINDIYGQSTSGGINQDEEIDITDYLTSDSDGLPEVGWHSVEITPDGATFLKSRVFLDHKKDN